MRYFLITCCISILCTLSSAQSNQALFINEFLASNVSVNADILDFDDYSDWIELYNDEDFDVDIGGYYLTDDLDNPSRWTVPAGTKIKTKGFLRFWADGYDEKPGQTYKRSWLGPDARPIYFTTKYYHLNFKLSQAGEYIGLYNPQGILVDSVSFGLQIKDVSMGRKPDGSEYWMYFGEPTPETSNNTNGTLNTEFAQTTEISPESGFYHGNQSVSIQAGSMEAVIKYTLDGSKPKSSSESFDTAFSITQTTILKARAYENDKLPGDIVYRTYFLNEDISLPVISITTPPEALWNSTFGIYNKTMADKEIPVTFEYFKTNGLPEFSLNAGLSLTGQASLYYPQKSFTIYARERYGADEINYPIFPQRELNTFKTLYFRNSGVPDNRSTLFRDALQHSLVINKMDIDCQAYQPSVVFLNGEYWGIYNIRDKINSNYLATIHNINPDDIDLLEYETSGIPIVKSGNADNYNLFYEYIKATDLSKEENYRFIETWMDINEYINYQICEIYYDNVFWPNQNMRMWRERKDDGKWRWILFDTDYGFGMPNIYSSGYSNNTLRFATSSNPNGNEAPLWSTLIFRKLLANKEFETKFIQRFESYMNSIFHADTVMAVINQFEIRLSPEMPRHIKRWRNGEFYYGYPIQNIYEWISNVDGLKSFAIQRPRYQRQHIIDYFGLSGTSVLNLVIEEPGMGIILINGVDLTDKSVTGIYFKDVPVELKAIPGIGQKFVKWKGIENDTINPVSIVLNTDSLTVTALFDTVSINILPSTIYRDTTLVNNNSPYYATGDIVVDSCKTLKIEEGVEILMPENASIIVYGKLIIEGTAENPVLISPNENSKNWGALCFVNACDSSIVSNLKITGATKGPDFIRDRAGISGYNSNFSLQNVTLEKVDFPIFAEYGNIYIGGCTLHSISAGDLININYASSVVIENCDFSGSDDFDSDAIDLGGVLKAIIQGNRIYNIYGVNSDGIDLGENSKEILIENNVIYNIQDKGISIGGGSEAIVKRNSVANCAQGIGIKDNGSYAYIENNTFYANQTGVACFEKNIGRGGGDADVVNCIFANSSQADVYTDEFSNSEVSFSLSNTEILPGIHNIHGDPLFLNNLRLAVNSPAINSGNPTLPNDPDGSAPDMGAYPFDKENQVNLIINEIYYNPIEGENSEFIEIVNAASSSINLKGFQLSGNVDYIFPDELIAAGEIFLVAKNRSVYQGDEFKVFQWENGSLKNTPGRIILSNNEADIIDFVNYNSRDWWPKEPDGQSLSLELHNTGMENMVSTSWRSSYNNGGTPGKSNSSVLITGITINEFLAANSSVNADENGDYSDWIEFYNNNDNPVNLGGLYITDKLDNPVKFMVPVYSPDQTTIPAKGYLLFWADGQPERGVLHLGFKLDKSGEQIGLAQVTGNQIKFIDSLTYSRQTDDVSFGRYPDGAANCREFEIVTPLQSNLITSIEEKKILSEKIQLQNYPNPFHSKTVISYELSESLEVELNVYDLFGRKIVTLLKELQPPGKYRQDWNAENMQPGIYICELRTRQDKQVLKIILID